MTFATQEQIHAYNVAHVTLGHSIVYGLCDPRTLEIRYIGVTGVDPRRRFNSHTCEASGGKQTHKCHWMRKVRREAGSWPLSAVLDIVKNEARDEAERRLIAENKSRLVNGTDGGEGMLGLKHSEETRKRMSEAGMKRWKKHPITESTRAKLSEAQKGRAPISEETRKKMSEARQRRLPRSAESRAKTSAAIKAYRAKNGPQVFSEETKAKISATLSGRKITGRKRTAPYTEIEKANLQRASQRHRKPMAEETKQKIGEANRNPSAETRRKMSTAAKARCLRALIDG